MHHPSAKSADSIENVINRYGDSLYRLCLILLKNESDAEDALQETMIQYYRKSPAFADSEHEKAWLITVATNKCRDMLRFRARHPQLDTDFLPDTLPESPDSGILDALASLPEKYRLVLTLHYIEEYAIAEIAKIIRKTPSAVKMRLMRGRKLLEEIYRKEYL